MIIHEAKYKAAHPTYDLAPIGAAIGSYLVCILAITEIYYIANMHDTNFEDIDFHVRNPFNDILTPNHQISSG